MRRCGHQSDPLRRALRVGEHHHPGAGEGTHGVGLVVAEGARDLVADDVAQHAAEHGGHHAHEHGHDGRHRGVERDLRAAGGEQAQTQRIGPLHGALGEREVPRAQEEHRSDAQRQQQPEPDRVLDPEEGPPVHQDVAQRAAAEGGQTGDHADADGIEPLARCGDQAGEREGHGGGRLDRDLRVGQRPDVGQRQALHGGSISEVIGRMVERVAADRPIRPWHHRPWPGAPRPEDDAMPLKQQIRFCTAPDGVRIAYATSGKGPPLLKVGNWLSHLEFDCTSPVWGHVLDELSSQAHPDALRPARHAACRTGRSQTCRFDAWLQRPRDRGRCRRASSASRCSAISQGAADRHRLRGAPSRARDAPGAAWRLCARAPQARRRRRLFDEEAEMQAQADGDRLGPRRTPAFRQFFTSQFIPGGTPEQHHWFNELAAGVDLARQRGAHSCASSTTSTWPSCCRRCSARRWCCIPPATCACPSTRAG